MDDTIEVMFPDGLRQVPSQSRIKESGKLSREDMRVDLGPEPAPDPAWQFVQVIDRSWRAFPR